LEKLHITTTGEYGGNGTGVIQIKTHAVMEREWDSSHVQRIVQLSCKVCSGQQSYAERIGQQSYAERIGQQS